ncbi:carbohydrate-binding domain-containing protein [Roseburia sp. BX1005]|uniref:Carbohydrate-binding domain-containing protein n=1 Tax=Roseburia zhanii TaxID=2763064 RepID=A0A923LNW9_9FIRM|nr:carbohydrate-binding domain-containing protein [Roseburia zhanii]MBC5714380.1 carbohydrate-binding domain-containing protein [Roseburia zhanii]
MKSQFRRNFAKLLVAAMVVSQIAIPGSAVYADAADTTDASWENAATFTFSDEGITSEGAADETYTVKGTALTIKAEGTYVLKGSCTDGSVKVKKETKNVVIVLDGLTLTSQTTAPICVNKTAEAEIIAAAGTENTLADTAANASSDNTDAEKAVIKAKDGSTLTLSGSGTVNVSANGKNGIKGGATTALTVKEQNLNITSVDNALASDGSVTIDSGNIHIKSTEGDGIKSTPDDGDTDSAGTITLNGGTVTVEQAVDGIQAANAITITDGSYEVVCSDNAIKSDLSVQVDGGTLDLTAGGDGIKASNATSDATTDTTTDSSTTTDDSTTDDAATTTTTGDITINGGDITINAAGDDIQAEVSLTIADGIFDLTANGGASTTLASDADSCKGLKAGSDITINGGKYTINTADDAVHSNEYITVNAGTFNIKTGDDGMHADTSLIVGQESGDVQPTINIEQSYEGLEAGTVYVYGGDIDVVSSDDGINAAGGSSNGTDPGAPGTGGDGFNPGGGRPGGAGGPGGNGGFNQSAGNMGNTSTSSNYAIYMNGGDVFINAGGDGLDSNGPLTINGGTICVYGAAAGGTGSDNCPIDADGTILINGGTIFGAGSSQMVEYPSNASTQKYYLSTNTTYNAGTIVNIVDSSSNVLYTETLLKKANYILFSSADMGTSGSCSIKTGKISGSDSGNTGGSTGGNDSGNTGGSTGGNDSGTTGGSTGGSDSGNTGGNTGGTTGGTTGGSTTGTTDGTTSGSTTGTTDGNTSGTTTGTTNGNGSTDSTQTPSAAAAGTKLTDTQGKALYVVLDADAATVSYAGTTDKTAAKITIPATVEIDQVTYTVTAVAQKALYKNTKIKTVTIGKNVTVIGKSAFEGCKKLKSVTLPESLTQIGNRTFYNCVALTKIVIPSNVAKIGKQAFTNAKKLKNIVIRTTKLTAKNIGAKAFKGTAAKATVKVPKSKLKSYQKILVTKGMNKKAAIKK